MARIHTLAVLAALVIASACSSCKNTTKSTVAAQGDGTQAVGPTFNADSAYAYTAAQCAFGPRTMNSRAHDECGEWIASMFRAYDCDVTIQKANLKGYDGTVLRASNIIARRNPQAKQRLLVCAHWDSRPWADNDPDEANWHTPVMGADDGASGVAVMIELARLTQQDTTLNIGVDFVCFDAEDWGTPEWDYTRYDSESWALGAQHWAKTLPDDYAPRYGVLLDMVGGYGARFYKEQMSSYYASDIVDMVWSTAASIGLGSFFPVAEGTMVNDDHVAVNEHAHIPTIDIIPYYPDCNESSFGTTWHTLEDNMDNIDRSTLRAVGQLMVQLIYSE